MLLPVLILVIIAFGLLVVALLSGSVLWAWISVVVSVIAAIVLIADWMQRRSALKVGAAAGAAPSPRASVPDADPVTEVLPVVRSGPRGGPGSDVDGPTTAARTPNAAPAAPQQAASGPSGARRFDADADAQRTVVIPAVQPSGSDLRPSGAGNEITSSGGSSSQTVTTGAAGRPPVGTGTDQAEGRSGGTAAAAAGAAAATLAAGRSQTTDEKPPTLRKEPPAEAAPVGTSAVRPPEAPERPVEPSAPTRDPLSAPEPERSAAPDAPGGDTSAPASEPTPAEGPTGPDAETTVAVDARKSTVDTRKAAVGSAGAMGSAGAAPEPVGPAVADGEPPAGPATAAGVSDTVEVTPAVTGSAPPVAPPAAEKMDLFDSSAKSAPLDTPLGDGTPREAADLPVGGPGEPPQEPPAAAAPGEPQAAVEAPAGPDGEPPEETHDPVAAGVVRGLADEVVVVDEQPRYHLAGCRVAVVATVIPLPVREAVELGFTPCGWCRPDHTLAGRHS